MSAKWQRSKAWDDRHIPPALVPLKLALRALSSVWLGVGLLVLVVIYAVLASVPIGLLAKIPTMLVYGLSLLVTVALAAVLPAGGIRRILIARGRSRGVVFAWTLGVFLVLGVAGVWLWVRFFWPSTRYEPGDGRGLLLFAGFVEKYKAVTLRRLPAIEMSELEFYAWWPLRTVLLLFVTNMVVATVRRIEFNFKNLGVLSVHTGIVSIALGSAYYSTLKREGDTVLFAGELDAAGTPGPGPAQDRFFDNTRVALYIGDGRAREQRPLSGVPRYNDYGLDLFDAPRGTRSAWAMAMRMPEDELATAPLSIPVPNSAGRGVVDPGVKFRIVGYASYAQGADDWVEDDPAKRPLGAPVHAGEALNPLRMIYMYDRRADSAGGPGRPVLAYTALPTVPARRVADAQIGVEYTLGPTAGMTEERWRDLSEPLLPGTTAAVVVEIPGAPGGPFRGVYPITKGAKVTVGETGYGLEVKDISERPPFPIITPGYQDSESSVAVVRVTAPDGSAFERWVYHRFPEISQDMLDQKNENGMPKRRDADPAVRITFIDASPLVQVYFDEPAGTSGAGPVRAIVRRRGGEVRVIADVNAPGAGVELAPGIALTPGERWVNARRVERPEPVPVPQRDKSMVGTHDMAMLGVEVSMDVAGRGAWSTLVWLPFTKYVGIGQDADRDVVLPDGRRLSLMFGRLQHRLPGFAVQLIDFKMLAYDHRGSPRDYQSVLRVTPFEDSTSGGRADFEAFEHVARLNEPLTAPFLWSDERSWLSNVAGRLASGVSPNQFKFSQAGWDQNGWLRTQQETDRGMRRRPFASFTILGVGNYPGIHIIAAGAVLMGLGIPWAFYVKPWLVRREKQRIQRELAAGTYRKPGADGANGRENGSVSGQGSERRRDAAGACA